MAAASPCSSAASRSSSTESASAASPPRAAMANRTSPAAKQASPPSWQVSRNDPQEMSIRGPLSKLVSERIRGQILDGSRKPGERLIEDRLSIELGVSRVPVREALRGLSAEGLVLISPRRGASVAEITPQVVAE